MFPVQQKLFDDVTADAVNPKVVTEFKIIWGQRSGKSLVIEKLSNDFDMIVFSEAIAQAKKQYSHRTTVYGYGMAPGDVTVTLRNLKKFSKVPEILVLEDFDLSGLSPRDVVNFMLAVRESCKECGVATILILSSYNKPSITGSLFDNTDKCQKLPTWEVNLGVTVNDLAPAFRNHYAKALRDYGCE